MKHKPLKASLPFNSFVENYNKKIKGLTLESFLFFVLQAPINKTCIVLDRETIEWASIVLQDHIPGSVLSLFSNNGALGDFDNLYNLLSSVSVQSYSNNLLPSICLVEEGVVDDVFLPTQETSFLNIDKNSSFESVLGWLEGSDFSFALDSQDLKKGGYYINGGIIDIKPFHSLGLYRISFLDLLCSIFVVDEKTNKINKKISSYKLFPERKNKKLSPLVALKEAGYAFKKYTKGVLDGCFSPLSGCWNPKIKAIDYHNFKSFFLNTKKTILPFVSDYGFVFMGEVFIPAWFQATNNIKKTKPHTTIEGFNTLVVGSFYTHEDFGICRFLGLEKHFKKERVCLEFADGKVRLDINYISKLSFFSGELNKKLHFLNRPALWKKQKGRAQEEAEKYVKSIIKTYSNREEITVKPLNTKDKLISDFVGEFKHKDTPDQALCWQEILKDFKKGRPINRLVCGDVGFGKTEIAIRTAFVSILNNLPVIVLAPTTILTKQLYHSFLERLHPFGVSVKTVSSLSKNKEKNIENFINKKTDILIGTSSLLFQKKVLRSCGFFIVDEEHRFGVKDKELILKINPSVHFLSLSATPIPRSLELSLSKIRNLSLIQTPPLERKPVVCFVSEFDFKIVCNSILKEVGRGGQVFFVDNSVDNLKKMSVRLLKKLPNISFDLIYSGLQKNKLIGAMDGFIEGKTQVLLSTTIIESGIDIGQANTIIINNAHLFGLSQLYQLRGRVGRSFSQAFAWFLFPLKKQRGDAKKRIKSIIKHTSLGSGYRIALSDLEIRGSGSLFGYKQSGEGGVGFEYYTKLIALASNPQKEENCVVDIFDTGLEKIISDERQRSFFYKCVFSANTKKEINKAREDFLSFFGSIPLPFLFLLQTRELALMAKTKKIIKLVKSSNFIVLTFSNNQPGGFLDFIIPYISSFFGKRDIPFQFLSNKKNFTFQYKNIQENDYILLVSFFNKLSF